MHKEMRRKDRLLSDQETRAVLEKGRYGVLATVDADGAPYGVPISYAVMNGEIYFHCAKTGEKLDNIARNPAVSFTVVGDIQPVFDGGFTTNYESAVAFGKAREVTDPKEKRDAFLAMVMKYLPGHADAFDHEMRKEPNTRMFAVSCDRLTGKSRKISVKS